MIKSICKRKWNITAISFATELQVSFRFNWRKVNKRPLQFSKYNLENQLRT